MKTKTHIVSILLIAGTLVSLCSGQSLLTNGDFETGDFASWNVVPFSQYSPGVVSTSVTGWGGYALEMARENNTFANYPGVYQAFDASGSSQINVSFDYQLDAGESIVFRIAAIDGGTSYVYDGADWNVASITETTGFYQQDWGVDASNSAAYYNLEARTVVLSSAVTTVDSYSLNLDLYSSSTITYHIDFFNPITGTAVQLDNISVTVIPEPSAAALLLGGFSLFVIFALRKFRATR